MRNWVDESRASRASEGDRIAARMANFVSMCCFCSSGNTSQYCEANGMSAAITTAANARRVIPLRPLITTAEVSRVARQLPTKPYREATQMQRMIEVLGMHSSSHLSQPFAVSLSHRAHAAPNVAHTEI